MDVLAPTTMKNAVKCDTSCESQNPVSHQNFERSLHFLGSMSVGVSVPLIPLCGDVNHSHRERVKMQCVSNFVSYDIVGILVSRQDVSDRSLARVFIPQSLNEIDIVRTSTQSRIPAEFKHIIRRRKRN